MGNQDTLEPDSRFRSAVFRTVLHHGDLNGHEPQAQFLVAQSLIACDGAVWMRQSVCFSIVLATGDVSGDKHFQFDHSVIVVDGDVRAFSCGNAVVVARGNVRIEHAESNRLRSHIYAGGRVEIHSFSHKGEQAQFDARTATIEGGDIKEGVKRPLDFVRFFETSDVGVEAAKAENGIKLQKLTTDSPLAKAGLKAGDNVLAIDGNKTPDLDTLRRQLRRAYVSQEATFSVRRDGKELEVLVSFYGYELPKDK
jgi:membrane-associated protease RseP (regulator of RpoE activity)